MNVLGTVVAGRRPRHGHQRDGVGREQAHVQEELEEVLLVPFADAVVDPRAVVVHLTDAALADAAVMRARGAVHLASANSLELVTFGFYKEMNRAVFG